MYKNTKLINIFGGPGIGKSTAALDLSAKLKKKGYDAELVTEVSKDFTWEKRTKTLEIQPYVTIKQYRNLIRLHGQVDYIITDGPILMGIVYAKLYDDLPESYTRLVFDLHEKFDSLNINLTRKFDYYPNGRNQNEEDAKSIDVKIKEVLDFYSPDYVECTSDKIKKTVRKELGLW